MNEVQGDKTILPEGKLLRLNEWAEPLGWVLAIFAVLGGALFLIPPMRSLQFDDSFRLLLGLAWLAFGLLMASGARAGITVRCEGVSLQTLLRGYRFGWNDIREFRLSRSWLRPGVKIQLQSGKEFSVVSLSPGSAYERRLAEEMVAELNHRAHSAHTPSRVGRIEPGSAEGGR